MTFNAALPLSGYRVQLKERASRSKTIQQCQRVFCNHFSLSFGSCFLCFQQPAPLCLHCTDECLECASMALSLSAQFCWDASVCLCVCVCLWWKLDFNIGKLISLGADLFKFCSFEFFFFLLLPLSSSSSSCYTCTDESGWGTIVVCLIA